MGKLLILTRYIFLIYSVNINESRKHIHVTFNRKGYKKSCKFWLEPEAILDENKKGEFSVKELKEIKELVIENKLVLLAQLELFYTNHLVKAIKR